MGPTDTTKTLKTDADQPVPYKSRVDNRPLTDNEKILWCVLGGTGIFSMLLLFVLMALFHSPLASN